MAVRGTTQGLALTPARWATWVAQRHEWNGYLWIRWSDAEAVLLFVSGRPRIHLWDGAGWVEGEHALTTVARRLERLPPPRWGQVAIPARWAAGLRDLPLLQPALPAEVLSPEAWVAWAQRQGFTGVAVLVGDVAAAWIVQDGLVRAVRFHQGAVVNDDGAAPPQEGVLQIYRGRVALDLSPPLEPPPLRGFTPLPEVEVTPARTTTPVQPVEVPPMEVSPVQTPPAEAAASSAGPPTEAPAVPETTPPQSPASEVPAAAAPAPAAKVSPPAPAESGETTVVPARSEVARRFRGDERFLLAPTVDLTNPEDLLDLITDHGEDILGWLPLLDGTRSLEEVARAGLVPLGAVDAVVGWLADRRLVFRRYSGRPRTPAPSQ